MIIGCGVDIVNSNRFEKFTSNEKFLERFFNKKEIDLIRRNNTIAKESLAVRFAAKEAFGKALGTGIGCLTLKNICVIKDELGKPLLLVFDDVKEKLDKSGANIIHLSLSHDNDYAIAQVILEKTGENV